jgi:hypothetical protein
MPSAAEPKNHHTCHGWKITPVVAACTLGWAAGGDASSTGATKTSAIPHAIMSAHRRRSGSASSTGPTASSAHALLPTASPSSTPAHVARPRSAASTAPADNAAPSNSSGWPMSSARSVIGLHAHSATTIATVPRPAPRASRLEASTTPSAAPASRHGTATARNTATSPPPSPCAASANGARMISEPP